MNRTPRDPAADRDTDDHRDARTSRAAPGADPNENLERWEREIRQGPNPLGEDGQADGDTRPSR